MIREAQVGNLWAKNGVWECAEACAPGKVVNRRPQAEVFVLGASIGPLAQVPD